MKMTPEIEVMWRECYGNTYKDVLGKRLVSWFRHEGKIYRIGDIIDVINDGFLVGSDITTCEIVSAGSTTKLPGAPVKSRYHRRRAILVKIIAGGPWNPHQLTGIFLWSTSRNHIRHNVIHTLATIGD